MAGIVSKFDVVPLVDRQTLLASGGFDEGSPDAGRWRGLMSLLRDGYILLASAPGLVRTRTAAYSPAEVLGLQEVLDSTGREARTSSNAPNPYPDAVGDYRLAIQKTELAIRQATQMALDRGDLGVIEELLAGRPNPQLRFHLDFEALIAEEVSTVLGVGDNEKALAAELRTISEPLVAECKRVMVSPRLPSALAPGPVPCFARRDRATESQTAAQSSHSHSIEPGSQTQRPRTQTG